MSSTTTSTKRSLSEFNNELKQKGITIFKIEDDSEETRVYSRKDFYKICLTTGSSIIHYADRSFETHDTVLFFGNPHIPYSWETLSTEYVGYTCLFSEDFLAQADRKESLLQSPLFQLGGTPVLAINQGQRAFLNTIFEKMMDEQQSDYRYKNDLLRNYINLILHEALKLEPAKSDHQPKNAAARLTRVFLELLERQFPIEEKDHPLSLRTAHDYADNLAVHTNYLNRSVRTVTGRSTTELITDRIIGEAKALLQQTDWNINEIAYALGFEYPTYFNNLFKKQTGRTPSSLRA